MDRIRRLALSAVALAGLSRAASAQRRIPRVAFLANFIPMAELVKGSRSGVTQIAMFVDGLAARGWNEGANLSFVWRSAEGDLSRHPALALELVHVPVDVIVANTEGVDAAARATRTIPIVMSGYYSPVERGLAKSLARPGGNITGNALTAGAEFGKQLALLKDAVPSARRVAMIARANGEHVDRDLRVPSSYAKTAAALDMEVFLLTFGEASSVDAVMESAARQGAQAFWIEPTFAINGLRENRRRVIDAANRLRLPAMHNSLEAVADGGLMAYVADESVWWRRTPQYVDRILRGGNPATIPIEQVSEPQLHLNARAARAIGIALPAALLVSAHRIYD